MSERFYKHAFDLSAQKSDSVDLTVRPKAIYVGGAGDITVDMRDAQNTSTVTVTFKAVPVGTVLEIQPIRLRSSGTSATLLLGLY